MSDYELEDQVNDRISFSKFVGLSLEDSVPDHSVISRFRSELTKKRAFEKIFQLINQQLEKVNIIVRTSQPILSNFKKKCNRELTQKLAG